MPEAVHINIACLSRSKSGPHAYGVAVSTPLGDVLVEKQALITDAAAVQTSYMALLLGLEEASRCGARRVVVYADSESMVNQMRGRLSVREDAVKSLHHRAWLLAARLQFQIIHVLPDRNAVATGLARTALGEVPAPPAPTPVPVPTVEVVPRKSGIQRSAGGMVYKREGEKVFICLIAKGKVWALPKGRLNDGETPDQTATREILEETGHQSAIEERLRDIDYWFYWKDNNTLYHKTVTFFLMRLVEENAAQPDGEADQVAWFPLAEAWEKLTYPNEKDVLRRGQTWLRAAPP
ncbi:MAG TPA: NUDIX domain-containing protein [Candidatus Xenobia bacterium]|jgi:ADP-ribose pyrophosphatase YjhB (NUDIX family)/ribonuclease HI